MRILIVEDQRDLSEAISTYLSQNQHQYDQAFTIREAKLMLESAEYAAILLDLMLPDGLGINLLKEHRRKGGDCPVIIMTAKDQITDRIAGLESGADDYLIKPFNLDEMLARLNAIMRRSPNYSERIQKFGTVEFNLKNKMCSKNGGEIHLTAKEWAILERLTNSPNQIVSKKSLEDAIYSFSSEIESNTLEVYISSIRKKLGPKLIETHRGLGYRLGKL